MTFLLAFAIGFSVASLPGPIIVLITTETLRRGVKPGLLTAIAPVLIDALVMVPLALLLQASLLTGKGAVLMGLIGSGFLVWLGFQSMRARTNKFRVSDYGFRGLDPSMNSGSTLSKAERVKTPNSKLQTPADSNQEMPSFLKGVLTHLTNPYPYLYWGTVGSTFIRQGFENGGVWGAALFPSGFWAGATFMNFLAVYLVARTKKLLPPRLDRYLHHLSGALLIGSGVFLAMRVWQGFF